jgi:hypothetical protein
LARTAQQLRQGSGAGSTGALLRYLARVRTARVDREGRKQLARMLSISADFHLELALIDLQSRGLVTIDGDIVTLFKRRTAAPR